MLMVVVLELLVALVVGFVLGRIWEIGQRSGRTAFTGTLPTDSARSMRIDKLRRLQTTHCTRLNTLIA